MLEHPNKTRVYSRGEIHSHQPGDKSHRLEIKEEHIKLAKRMRRLVNYFNLSESDVNQIIKNEFGEGVGYQTTRIFMDQLYGPGFRLRLKTEEKYKYLVRFLTKMKKRFAKSGN